jgi:murein DD-endopeptidase MepM/ murein hydrolase activator NlpD
LLVHSGQRVAAGQAVAVIGGSGQATSPHLHFEVWRDGVAVDPRTVISGDPEKPVDTAP